MKIQCPLMLIQMVRMQLKLTVGKQRGLLPFKQGHKPRATDAGAGKPPKHPRKLTSTVWEHYEFLPPDEEGNLFCKCKKLVKLILNIASTEWKFEKAAYDRLAVLYSFGQIRLAGL